MRATPHLTTFNHWLSGDTKAAARAVILHGTEPSAIEHLVADLATYLNQHDSQGSGLWLSACSRLVEEISLCSEPRRLLGITGEPPHPPLDHADMRGALIALARRGRVVFQDYSPKGDDFGLPGAFHVWIASSAPAVEKCDLALDPSGVKEEDIPRIVGDAFLDWQHHSAEAG